MEDGAHGPVGDRLTGLFRKFAVFAGLLIAIGGVTWGIYTWRHRFVRDNADLFRYLPDGPGSTFFADVRQIRQAGFASLLAGSQGVLHDPDYEDFVRQTGFDYTRDLDTIAAKTGSVPVLVARGRFDWTRLRPYATQRNEAKTARQITFQQIQPDVILLKTGSVPVSTPQLAHTSAPEKGTDPISAPVWLRLAPEVLLHPEDLSPVLRIFAISLGQQATDVVLSLSPAAEASGSALVLNFRATLPNSSTADTIRTQLELQTQVLALGLKRQHLPPDPASLTGLLTAGTFESAGKTVRGTWPIRNELLRALQ